MKIRNDSVIMYVAFNDSEQLLNNAKISYFERNTFQLRKFFVRIWLFSEKMVLHLQVYFHEIYYELFRFFKGGIG